MRLSILVLAVLATAVFSRSLLPSHVADLLHKRSLKNTMVTSPEYAAKLNALAVGWEATHYERFDNMSLADFKKCFLGLKSLKVRGIPVAEAPENFEAPDSFDARTQWPNLITPILDQGQCGSCWAFGASEAISDRFAIASKASGVTVLSSQFLVSCDNTDYGCNGGYLDHVWKFLETKGTVSEKCWSYKSGKGSVPSCNTFKSCEDQSTPKYYFVKAGSTKQFRTPATIKAEILANGPVETGFTVYQDFMSYKSGIYKHVSGGVLGGHAVKIIGWGVEGGVNYWLAANSWNTGWGEKGTFKIAEGQCGFDSQAIAGVADLTK